MPRHLRCPACAAPLDPSSVDGDFVRCPYCGSSARLEDASEPAPPPPAPAAPRRTTLVLAAAGVVAALGVGAAAFLAGDPAPAAEAIAPPAPPAAPAAPPEPAERGPMEPVVRFGREGTGAGGFDDARAVAMAPDGRIYVGEYGGGRIQAFDSTGAFLTQWNTGSRMPMLDLETDRAGRVYVVQAGRVLRFDAAGAPLDDLVPRGRGAGIDDLAPALDGTFWAVAGDAVVRLDAEGAVLRRIRLREAVGEDAAPGRVAVAGDGELFVTDAWTGEVYRFGADGRFADRFGTRSRAGGAFAGLAVDGRGRVFVSGMSGIQVFDRQGKPLGQLGDSGVVFGMGVLDDRALLAGTYRNAHEVRIYRLPPP